MKLKTLRHPNVLTFLDFLEFESTLYLITEPCKPLKVYFDDNQLSAAQKELVVSWGLYQVLVSFFYFILFFINFFLELFKILA